MQTVTIQKAKAQLSRLIAKARAADWPGAEDLGFE
jgi:hypothetical protein